MTETSRRAPLAGRVAVITGASSGIGRAAAQALALQGAHLVLAARGEEALEKAAEECRELGAEAVAVQTDVGNQDEVLELRERALQRFGTFDIWISNAAVTSFGRIEDTPAEDFERILRTNVLGAVHSARSAVPWYREQGRGTFVIVSSVVGLIGQPYTAAYCASKGALLRLAESLRQELADVPQVRVCTLLPSSTDTPIFRTGANYTGRSARPVPPVYTARSVARDLVEMILRPRRERVSGSVGVAVKAGAALLPAWSERRVAQAVENGHFTRRRTRRSAGNLYAPAQGRGSVSGGWNGQEPVATSRAGLWLGLITAAAALAVWQARRE